jgi:hypothetical protein
MILAVMREVNRFFEVSIESGDFTLSKGKIQLNGNYKAGQYIILAGSILSDGLYKVVAVENGRYTLDLPRPPACRQAGPPVVDEKWRGTVYGLAIPSDFLVLCEEIREFQEKNGNSSLVSETVIGVHTWVRGTKTDGNRATGTPITWKDAFADRLNDYRSRMFKGVDI